MKRDPVPPLVDAVLKGDELLFRGRLQDRTTVNAVDRDGRSALHHAVIDNQFGFVTSLLHHGAEYPSDATPLMFQPAGVG